MSKITVTVETSKTQTNITFGENADNQTFTIVEGDEASFTAPTATLTPAEAGTITYSSSNENVASVDATTGKVTLGNTFGTTTITASYAGNDTYLSSKAEYTIKYKSSAEPILFNEDIGSFANCGSSGYTENTNTERQLLANNNNKYTFTLNAAYHYNKGIQIQKDKGTITSPKFGFANGYTVTVTTSTNNIKITSGELSAVGTNNVCKLTIPADATFTIATNGAYAVISEIEIVPAKAKAITLDEAQANTITAAENVTVSLVRTLDNTDWNTFCVPFAITAEQVTAVFGEGTKITEFTSADEANKKMMFTTTESIEAGKPYLVLPGNAEVKNPTFNNVTIVEGEPQVVTYGDYTFAGVYSPYEMKTDRTELFIGANGKLFVPAATTNKMKGMRAFIRLSSADAKLLSIDINGGGTTGIGATESAKAQDGNIYDLSGRRMGKDINNIGRGIYIVNGKKIIK